jgi:hypothetical protein
VVSEMPDYTSVLAEITQVTRKLLGDTKRRIVLLPETDLEGTPLIRLEIDILAKESHSAEKLSQLRAMLNIVFDRHPELGDVHLTFKVFGSSAAASRKRGPDVSDIRRMIESLP